MELPKYAHIRDFITIGPRIWTVDDCIYDSYTDRQTDIIPKNTFLNSRRSKATNKYDNRISDPPYNFILCIFERLKIVIYLY